MPSPPTACVFALLLTALGCGAERAESPGAPSRTSEGAAPAVRPEQPLWAERARVLEWPLVPEQAFLSRGHPGRWTSRTRVDPTLRERYLAREPSYAFPPGTLLIAELTADGGERGPSLVMSKRDAATWDFFQVDGQGHLDTSHAAACARCHAEAPYDQVYGVPVPRASASGSTAPAASVAPPRARP